MARYWPFQPSEVTLRVINLGSGRDPGPGLPCSWVWSWASQCGPQRDELSSVLGPGLSLLPPCFLAQPVLTAGVPPEGGLVAGPGGCRC